MICEACGVNNSAGARSCSQCGSELGVHCPKCGGEAAAAARFCSACGHALFTPAKSGREDREPAPALTAGERKQVTFLFGDFSGYTKFSERLDPEELHDNMDAIWASLDAIIIAHGGRTESHAGDGVMAVFGDRRSREEDPAEAGRAALAMQAWLKARKPDDQTASLQMRIGINTGVVVVGLGDLTGEFLAAGDATNLAARLEQNAPVGGVLISGETNRLVFGIFDVQTMPPLTVKGKSEPVESYLVVRAKSRGLVRQMRGIQGVETEMIGRQLELDRLQDDFRRVLRERVPQTTVVVGEAGIGKSRLFFEFYQKTELFPEYFRVFCGRAAAETGSLPFALIRDLFTARFEIQESDPVAVAREKFERGLTGLLGGDDGLPAELVPDMHFLGQLIGLDFSASPHVRGILDDAEQIRQRAFHGFRRCLETLSQRPATRQEPQISGVLLVLEDLQWCDDRSLELIEHLIRHSQGVPLMILCSARPAFFERHPGWCEALPKVARLDLDALSHSESTALVGTILRQARNIPPALNDLLTQGADGNPFFIEELIKMLMDQGVIVSQADGWRIEMERLAGTRVPATLTGVLQARLDGLAPAERWILQRASVAGRVFWDSAVEQMGLAGHPKPPPGSPFEAALSREQISKVLMELRAKELVFRRESTAFAGAAEYIFKHELLRNVAYESLLKKTRRQHHAQFAEWLQEHAGDRLAEFAPLIATHFEQAARLAEAAEWHGRAGQQARLGYSPATAIDHFKKALQLSSKGGGPESAGLKQQLEWQEGLVETLGAQARFAEALAASRLVRELAHELADLVAEARAWNGLAFLHERQGDNRASVDCAGKAEALALQAAVAGRAERIRALLIKGWAFYRMGDVATVLELSDQLLKLCAEQGDRRGPAAGLKLLGVAHLQLGHYAQAEGFFEQGLALSMELGDERTTAAMWSNRGECARACGDFERAAGLYEQALAIGRKIGSRESELVYLTNLAGARLGIGQFEQAEMDLRHVISQTAAPNSCALAETYAYLGEACLGQGRLPEAVKTAQKAINLALESESPLYLGEAWRALGRIGAAVARQRSQSAGDTEFRLATTDPVHCFAESLRVFRSINAAGEAARTLRDWAELECHQGQTASGRQKLAEARDAFEQLGARPEVAATEKLLGTL